MIDRCSFTLPVPSGGVLECDLPAGHVGTKHITYLMNPFFPGKVAFTHEWTIDDAP